MSNQEDVKEVPKGLPPTAYKTIETAMKLLFSACDAAGMDVALIFHWHEGTPDGRACCYGICATDGEPEYHISGYALAVVDQGGRIPNLPKPTGGTIH